MICVDELAVGRQLSRMTHCFRESDVKELGKTVLSDFDRRLAALPEGLCALS